MRTLEDRKRQLDLKEEQVRALHARAFSSAVIRYADDQWVDERERDKLCRLYRCLSQLGWAPGE